MSKYLVSILVIFIGVTIFGCIPTNDDPVWGVGGFVSDIESHDPLENVLCNIVGDRHDYSMMSDSLGRFIVAPFGDPPDSVIMYFAKDGYNRLDTVLFFADGERFIGSVDIYLEPVP